MAQATVRRRASQNGTMRTSSVFAEHLPHVFPYRFAGTLHVDRIAGGTPSDPDVAAAWIRSKGYKDIKDQLIVDEVAKIMDERGMDEADAVEELTRRRHLSGFKRDPEYGLYIEGRQLKACLKEAAGIALAADKLPKRWGTTHKGCIGFVTEHINVVEYRLYLGVLEPSEVVQGFVHTFRGSGIQYAEIVNDAEISFTVESDYEFSEKEWATLWLTAERAGLGAGRSQGNGRFQVVSWERVSARRRKAVTA